MGMSNRVISRFERSIESGSEIENRSPYFDFRPKCLLIYSDVYNLVTAL